MSTLTNGQICYGVLFEEDFDFPWGEEDPEDWWRDTIQGYKRPFEIYTEDGDYIGGVRPDQSRLDEYFNHRRDFEKTHPFPVELVNCCSADYPRYIIAARSTVKVARRGYPEQFSADEISVTIEDANALVDFIRKYIQPNGEIKAGWYLSSYWG